VIIGISMLILPIDPLNVKFVAYSPNGMDDLNVEEVKPIDTDKSLPLDNNALLFDPINDMFSPGQDMDWVSSAKLHMRMITQLTQPKAYMGQYHPEQPGSDTNHPFWRPKYALVLEFSRQQYAFVGWLREPCD
jgi:hypothetical protein